MPVSVGSYSQGPSCLDKVKFGFATGALAGLILGFTFGGYSGFKYGLRGMELMKSVCKVSVQGIGTFGTFMAIGSVIRC